MILHRLLAHHVRHGPDEAFYRLQAVDAVGWLDRQGTGLEPGDRVLDLGCGTGVLGRQLLERGCDVVFADVENGLPAEVPSERFRKVNIDADDWGELGRFELVICSNVLEHLARPCRLLTGLERLVTAGGHVYLSWTNWLSPWGGHDFSPFHYLGPRLGPWLFDRLTGRSRRLEPYVNLFPTHIGATLRLLRSRTRLQILRVVPRYYPELAGLMRIPWVREFLAWNCAILMRRPVSTGVGPAGSG